MSTERRREIIPALGLHVLTPAYDAAVRCTTRESIVKAALLAQADIQPTDVVLDLGCGTGTLAIAAKQRQPSAVVVGVDADPIVLRTARRKAAERCVDVALCLGDATALPHRDGHFDRALSSLLFHHLTWSDKLTAASELFRVLRPGGELHVVDWGPPSGSLTRAAFLVVQLVDGFDRTRDNVRGRLIEVFDKAGFARVAATRSFDTSLGTLSLYRAYKEKW